jgi:hypothetical protein
MERKDGVSGKQIERERKRETDRQADRQAGRQTDRQIVGRINRDKQI